MEIKSGDIVRYSAFGGRIRTVLVDEVFENIKNERPGFDGEVIKGTEKGDLVWGYLNQITKIVKRC